MGICFASYELARRENEGLARAAGAEAQSAAELHYVLRMYVGDSLLLVARGDTSWISVRPDDRYREGPVNVVLPDSVVDKYRWVRFGRGGR
jgi:hypothetical protein